MTDKCILCDVELDTIILTEVGTGPLCADCFSIYRWDKPEFWRRLKEKSGAVFLGKMIPFDTENRPSVLDKCVRCGHLYLYHNLACSKCDCKEFMVWVKG
jgi:hypothetical protein